MVKKSFVVYVCLCLVLSQGCAAVIRGNHQEVRINSVPPGAEGHVDGVYIQTPATVTLKRNKDHAVKLCKEGCEETEATIHSEISAGWMVADILLWGLFGLIDLAGGAYNLEPKDLVVPLQPSPPVGSASVENARVAQDGLSEGSSEFETSMPLVGSQLAVQTSACVFSGPSEQCDKIGTLPSGCNVEVKGKEGSWCRISCEEYSVAWIQASYLIASKPEEPAKAEHDEKTMVTVTRKTKIYPGPSSNNVILGTVPKGEQIEVLQEVQGYYRFSSDEFSNAWIKVEHTDGKQKQGSAQQERQSKAHPR